MYGTSCTHAIAHVPYPTAEGPRPNYLSSVLAQGRETIARETIAREKTARETIARETIARETIARETIARESIARQTIARLGPLFHFVFEPTCRHFDALRHCSCRRIKPVYSEYVCVCVDGCTHTNTRARTERERERERESERESERERERERERHRRRHIHNYMYICSYIFFGDTNTRGGAAR